MGDCLPSAASQLQLLLGVSGNDLPHHFLNLSILGLCTFVPFVSKKLLLTAPFFPCLSFVINPSVFILSNPEIVVLVDMVNLCQIITQPAVFVILAETNDNFLGMATIHELVNDAMLSNAAAREDETFATAEMLGTNFCHMNSQDLLLLGF